MAENRTGGRLIMIVGPAFSDLNPAKRSGFLSSIKREFQKTFIIE